MKNLEGRLNSDVAIWDIQALECGASILKEFAEVVNRLAFDPVITNVKVLSSLS